MEPKAIRSGVLPAPSKPTVLLVEDDGPLRDLFRTALLSAGYAVVAVDDGLAALHRTEQQPPDVVVLDLSLPRLDGRDVQRELAARPDTSRIPIIVVTGSDTSDLSSTDFAAVLRKPVHPESMVLAVANALRRIDRESEPA
jgi:CheY-like chemotaxis protein